MMELKWSSKALSDLARLHDFLAPTNAQAAARAVQSLIYAPERLLDHPRVGERLQEFEPLRGASYPGGQVRNALSK
jgi:plasmid stabilization system protein ParE